jgi:ABC-type nickel/cobalt efflux system permease component RcnA
MDIWLLIWSAIGIGIFHTLVGVDHTVPFIVLARAQKWNWGRLLGVTTVCGLGHVAASIVIASVGIGLGVATESVLGVEGARGSVAAWLLIGLGLTYTAWAVWQRLRGRAHEHTHVHEDGTLHDHRHDHAEDKHLHLHAKGRKAVTAAALFLVFVFGPCEFLIAPFMAAYTQGLGAVVLVATVFTVATVGTMLAVVSLGHLGLSMRRFDWAEQNLHVIAGLTIVLSGAAIHFLDI